MPRLTQDQWAAARIKWEADPTLTFEALAVALSVARPVVSRRAKAEGWKQVGALKGINERAQVRADAAEGTQSGTPYQSKKESIDASVDLRSKLIQSHRAEWRKHAGLYPLESIKAEFDEGRKAKISAEMLAIRQKGERLAWGLDDGNEKPTITIERSYGKTA